MTCGNSFDIEGGNSGPIGTSKAKTTRKGCSVSTVWRTLLGKLPKVVDLKQYGALAICGLAIWLLAYVSLGPAAAGLDGWLFGMAAVSTSGYVAGHALERCTTLPPLVGMTLVGVVFRNTRLATFHQHPTADAVDFHLRRIYPVIILTKGPLGWDWNYIKSNYTAVFALATLPWIVEWLSFTTAAFYIMDMPWIWGIHLGSIIASVSPAVVVPTVNKLRARGLGVKHDISRLVASSGGLDTAFTEGMFGVINAAIFVEASDAYRLTKGILAILVGIALGVAWGVLADALPQHADPHAVALRSLLVLSGGLLAMYAGAALGWGGTAGVAVMVCAGTAGTRWARRGWPLNSHPVAEVFRVLWVICEPMLFSLSGYYLELDEIQLERLLQILACLATALTLRVLTAVLVALTAGLTIQESIFIGITWIPKAIVEAVVIRAALDAVAPAADTPHARAHVHVIVVAILLTSTLGSALTTLLGPVLLRRDLKICPADSPPDCSREDSVPRRASTA